MSILVEWEDDAIADLDRIIDYIEVESPQGALTIALAIRRGANSLLSEFPKAGRQGRVPGTRELIVVGTPFIVVYVVDGERVEIIRVLHGRQQWPSN